MKSIFFTSCFLFLFADTQHKSGKALFYCIDHPGKTIYYSTGDAVIKKGLEKSEYYQYGFMKWKGWINKSWQGLEYDLKLYPSTGFSSTAKRVSDSLTVLYRAKGYEVTKVPMAYPMKPYNNYKKDGTN